MAWDATAICSNNPDYGGRGNPKQGDEFAAAPNIDHTQVGSTVIIKRQLACAPPLARLGHV